MAKVRQRTIRNRQASRQECRRLHTNTNDRGPLVGWPIESIAVTRVRFKAIRDNDEARADLILCTPGFIAKCFSEQLHIADDRILNGSARKRKRPWTVCVRGAEIQVDLQIAMRIPRGQRLGVVKLECRTAVRCSGISPAAHNHAE